MKGKRNEIMNLMKELNDLKKKIKPSHVWGGFILILFAILLIASSYIDQVIKEFELSLSFPVIKLMLAYICYNEILSVAENLRAVGNEHMDKLIEILNANIFNKIKEK